MDDAMAGIERDHPALKGVLGRLYEDFLSQFAPRSEWFIGLFLGHIAPRCCETDLASRRFWELSQPADLGQQLLKRRVVRGQLAAVSVDHSGELVDLRRQLSIEGKGETIRSSCALQCSCRLQVHRFPFLRGQPECEVTRKPALIALNLLVQALNLSKR